MRWRFLFVALFASPAVAADDDALANAAKTLERVAPLVEKACGAKFEAPPRVEILSEGDAASAAAADMKREIDLRYAEVPDDKRASLLKIRASLSVRSCLARYSVSKREIVLVREAFDAQCAAAKATGPRAAQLLLVALAHECVHALDDERFDLGKTYARPTDLDGLLAAAMVIEGRAVRFGRAVAAQAGAPQDLVDLLPGGRTPRGEREWLPRLTYALGERFVGALVAEGGNALADKALAAPPRATWFVCVPSRWPDGRPSDAAAEAMKRAGFVDVKPLGELQLRAIYAATLGETDEERLFAEFAGGATVRVEETNAAVLAFADEASAKRYESASQSDAATARRGTLVARAMGPAKDDVLAKLALALDPPK